MTTYTKQQVIDYLLCSCDCNTSEQRIKAAFDKFPGITMAQMMQAAKEADVMHVKVVDPDQGIVDIEFKERPTTPKPVFPAFVFQRRSHVENEAGFILAGQLIVDIPKSTEPNEHEQAMIQGIIKQLLAKVKSGSVPADAELIGWRGGAKSENAVDIDNNELMSAWADRSLIIALRVDTRDSGEGLHLDSDVLAQMGMRKLDS
jgi:hypothetical protein